MVTKSLNMMKYKVYTSKIRALELVNPVPEATYNYKAFREPLIGQD